MSARVIPIEPVRRALQSKAATVRAAGSAPRADGAQPLPPARPLDAAERQLARDLFKGGNGAWPATRLAEVFGVEFAVMTAALRGLAG